MLKPFFIAAGTLSLLLGVLGIFLPVLPTTPFLLLTAFCYMRGSTRLYDKLMRHKVLGAYIRNFREHRAIPLRVKIVSVTLLWLTIACSAVFWVEKTWLRLLLAAVAVGVTIHILSFRTLRKPSEKAEKQEGK